VDGFPHRPQSRCENSRDLDDLSCHSTTAKPPTDWRPVGGGGLGGVLGKVTACLSHSGWGSVLLSKFEETSIFKSRVLENQLLSTFKLRSHGHGGLGGWAPLQSAAGGALRSHAHRICDSTAHAGWRCGWSSHRWRETAKVSSLVHSADKLCFEGAQFQCALWGQTSITFLWVGLDVNL
jgi:hypothetical protein